MVAQEMHHDDKTIFYGDGGGGEGHRRRLPKCRCRAYMDRIIWNGGTEKISQPRKVQRGHVPRHFIR